MLNRKLAGRPRDPRGESEDTGLDIFRGGPPFPRTAQYEELEQEGGTARGLVIGMAVGAVLWAIIGAGIWWVFA
jgi:hypothetical protein